MAVQYDTGIFSIEGLAGEILVGARLYFYVTGTSTPLATYSDQALTTPNSNPVVAGADGRFGPIWLQAATYKVVLKTALDITLVTRDPVVASSSVADLAAIAADLAALAVAYHERSFESFGAIGDGATNDQQSLRDAVAFQKAQIALGVQWRLKGKPGSVYYVGAITTPIVLDYDNAYIDLNGATVKYAQNSGTGGLFAIGAPFGTYNATDKPKPGPITVRGGTIDFNKGAQFCRGIHIKGPCKKVRILDMTFRQSAIAAGATPNNGDQWAIQLDNYVNFFTDSALDANSRAEDVLIQNCKSYDTMQLTAGGGNGVDGLRIFDNYVFEPRANGIAVTSISEQVRMDNVSIMRNTIIRAPGAGVYFGHDGISNQFVVNWGDYGVTFQHYGRNIQILGNVMVDCGEPIRIGGYAQGIYGLLIDGNDASNGLPGSVTARVTDTLTITPTAGIQALPELMHWAIDHHGGVDPVLADTAFDAATDIITFVAHKLPTGSGIIIVGAAGATMPAGIASGAPYVWKKETADTGSLWETMDAATGTPLNKVNIGAGAAGNFTVYFSTIIQDAIITSSNSFTGGANHLLAGFRSSQIDVKAPYGAQIGCMTDVRIGMFTEAPIRGNLGALLRVEFPPQFEARFRCGATIGARMMDFAPDPAWLYHLDVLLNGCTVSVDGSASLSTAQPTRFLRDQVTAANRRGRGWAARNIRWSLTNTGAFSGFADANPDNCWAFEGSSPAISTERFGGSATEFKHPYVRAANLGNMASGATATVAITCSGMRAADNATMAIQAIPLTNKSTFTQIMLTAECTVDDQIALTGANFSAGAIDPANTTFLFLIEGYR